MTVDQSVADDVGSAIGAALEAVRLGHNGEVELIAAAAEIASTFLAALPGFDARHFLYERCQLRAREVEAALKYIDWMRDDGGTDPLWDWSDALG